MRALLKGHTDKTVTRPEKSDLWKHDTVRDINHKISLINISG